jgi:hypothetical protein
MVGDKSGSCRLNEPHSFACSALNPFCSDDAKKEHCTATTSFCAYLYVPSNVIAYSQSGFYDFLRNIVYRRLQSSFYQRLVAPTYATNYYCPSILSLAPPRPASFPPRSMLVTSSAVVEVRMGAEPTPLGTLHPPPSSSLCCQSKSPELSNEANVEAVRVSEAVHPTPTTVANPRTVVKGS